MKQALRVLGLAILLINPAYANDDFPNLGVVPRNGGFRMEGYWVWCGSIIKGEDGLSAAP